MNTLITPDRIDSIKHLTTRAPASGAAAEVGVYKGGSLKVIAECFPNRVVYGFDTFGGLPREHWQANESHSVGDFSDTSLVSVQSFLIGNKNVRLLEGIFPKSAEEHGLNEEKFAFVHIDVDFYLAVRASLEWIWPRMVSGGLVVFDDFGWHRCPGVARALAEFGHKVYESAPLQAFLIKG